MRLRRVRSKQAGTLAFLKKRDARRLEATAQRDFRAWCNERGYAYKKISAVKGYDVGGWPDYIVFGRCCARVALVEVKRQGEKLTDLQRECAKDLRRRGVLVVVWEDRAPELEDLKLRLVAHFDCPTGEHA